MSLKNLFKDAAVTKTVANKTSAEIGAEVESGRYHEADIINEKRHVPRVDFSDPKNFAKYGSAEKYYEDAFTYIRSSYPYDGSLAEKLEWQNSGSYLDLYVFDHQYPRTNGYIQMSYTNWGTPGAHANGYGAPNTSADYEYISFDGGPHLKWTDGPQTQPANVWDPKNNQMSNLRVDFVSGSTVEFWLKKDAFNLANTEKEVILDIWNNELSSSAKYGRLRVELSGTAAASAWRVTAMSGTSGVQWAAIGTDTSTEVADSKWHHYAFTFVSSSDGLLTNYYVDGKPKAKQTLGTEGLGPIEGAMQAHIGALISEPSGSSAKAAFGKLSGSLDEFRFWKTKRTSKDIGRYWFTQVGGGTNTDLANVDLGVYYKFNEGITGVAATDSSVLDYSGRITNGSWRGYSAGARSTNSAIVEASASLSEFKDPIIYLINPLVSSKLAELKLSGSAHDYDSSSQMFSHLPSWIQAEDLSSGGGEVRKLTQILSSYLDALYLQIEEFGSIHDRAYVSGSAKPNTIANRLLESRGVAAPELFLDADVLEKLGDRSEKRLYRESLNDIKNTIYQNLYNNLATIFKSKGTRRSFRNLLRCFGVDEEIYKLNVYGNNIEYDVRNNRELDSAKKKFIDFNHRSRHKATVFQSASLDSAAYLTGSSALDNGFASTVETYILFPHKPDAFDPEHGLYEYPYLTASLFGQHSVGSDTADATWDTADASNFEVYAVRDTRESRDAHFVLTSSNGKIVTELSTSYYDDVYFNSNWVFGVTVRPQDYPLYSAVSGAAKSPYIVEFKGAQVEAGNTINSFFLTASLDPSVSTRLVTDSRRLYIGAHRQNYTGSVLTRSDVRVGFCRYWLDNISLPLIETHGKDVQNYGVSHPSFSPYLFENNFRPEVDIKELDTLALNWDFEIVSSSDDSGGFFVADFSSGSSANQASRYGSLGTLLAAKHPGGAFGFPANSTQVVDVDYVLADELQDFEILNSSDMISILDEDEVVLFTRESRPINFHFSIEKSMYRSVSEQMLNMFATIVDFNNIVGEPVQKYRLDYKQLRILREKFFERVGNSPDLDKFIEFYKWFDSSLSRLLQQLVPAGADFADDVRNVVESHILERNKYQYKYPTMELFDANPIGTVQTPLPLSPGWEFTHHPVNNLESHNAHWWKTRASRVKSKLATGNAAIDSQKQIMFNSAIMDTTRRLNMVALDADHVAGLKPYRFRQDQELVLHPGSNYPPEKRLSFVFDAAADNGGNVPGTTAPRNIMVSFAEEMQGLPDVVDVIDPYTTPRRHFKVNPTINKDNSLFGDGDLYVPFSIYSSSVTTGFNQEVIENYVSGVTITNLHEDLTFTGYQSPLQSPWSNHVVGGRQYRHTPLNTGNDNEDTRAEGFRIKFKGVLSKAGTAYTDKLLAVVPPRYPNLVHRPAAAKLRDDGIQRAFSIKNVLITTSSANSALTGRLANVKNHGPLGNYRGNYQVIQTSTRTVNDLYFVEAANSTFTFARFPETLATRGRFPLGPGSTANVGGNLDFQLPDRTGANSNETVFVPKFSAPGSYECSSRGYLVPPHGEMSVYNVVTYRNLTVRDHGLSGSDTDNSMAATIRVSDQLGKPRGLHQRLTLHCGPGGRDPIFGMSSWRTPGSFEGPSYHQTPPNRKPQLIRPNTTNTVITGSRFDNAWVQHPIPTSAQNYYWIGASMLSGATLFEHTFLEQGLFPPSLPLLSASTVPEVASDESPTGNQLVVNFNNLNIWIHEPVSASSNTLGYPLSAPLDIYRNLDFRHRMDKADLFNNLMLQRSGPYQWASWQQVRTGDHPIRRAHRKTSTITYEARTAYDRSVGSSRGNASTQVTEPVISSEHYPLLHRMKNTPSLAAAQSRTGTGLRSTNLVMKSVFGTALKGFSNYKLDNILGTMKNYESGDLYFNRINSLILKELDNDPAMAEVLSNITVDYTQRVYPAAYNAYLEKTHVRQKYSIGDVWDDQRTLRTSKPITLGQTQYNSQGHEILSQSIWPLDADVGHGMVQPTINTRKGAGELQNNYNRYDTPGSKQIKPAASYAWRVFAGTSGSDLVYGGDTEFEMQNAADSGVYSVPYQTYEEYCKYMRLQGLDYSLIPEFRISEHLAGYIEDDNSEWTTLDDITDLFDLTGSVYEGSSNQGFYKEYGNSDFLQFFSIVDKAYESVNLVDDSRLAKDSFTLRCDALIKPLPYKKFYPAEYVLELAQLFSQSVAPRTYTTYDAAWRTMLEPWSALINNSIKSGLAVGTVVAESGPSGSKGNADIALNGQPKTSANTILPEGVINFGTNAVLSGNLAPMYPFYNFVRKPFEALYQWGNYMGYDAISGSGNRPGYLFDTGVGSASLSSSNDGSHLMNKTLLRGTIGPLYPLAIDQFLASTLYNFIDPETRPIFLSSRQEDFQPRIIKGEKYALTFNLNRTLDKDSLRANRTGSGGFEMYDRASAFGAPYVFDGGTLETTSSGGAFATGYIDLTCSICTSGSKATGSLKIGAGGSSYDALVGDDARVYLTSSQGNNYTYTFWNKVIIDSTGNRWSVPTGSSDQHAAYFLNAAITASGFVTSDGGTSVWETGKANIHLSQSLTGTSGNGCLTASHMAAGSQFGMSGGVDPVYTFGWHDRWTLNDGGTDGAPATSRCFSFIPYAGAYEPYGCKDVVVPMGTNIGGTGGCSALTAATSFAVASNSMTGSGWNVSASASGNNTSARVTFTNMGTGSIGNTTITSVTGACGWGNYASGGMSGGEDAVWTSTTRYSASLAPHLPSYFYGKSSVTIVTSASWGGNPSLDNLLTNAEFIYDRDMETETYDKATAGAYLAQQISESFNLMNMTMDTSMTTDGRSMVPAPRWEISPKWECPILNFRGVTVSPAASASAPPAPGAASEITSRGMWHQHGNFPNRTEGVFASITTPASVTTSTAVIRNPKSLAQLVGFEENVSKRVGNVRSELIMKEAIVAVPFIVAKDGRRKFYRLPDTSPELVSLQDKLNTYIFPPTFDFVRNPTVDKISMYVFEFQVKLDKQDVADIWQNILPRAFRNPAKTDVFESAEQEISHKLLGQSLLNRSSRKLREDLRWLVFKVKQRSKSNYTKFAKSYVTNYLGGTPDNITSKYTYNWPNDYLSIVELIKIDASVGYRSTPPADSTTRILGDVNVRLDNAIGSDGTPSPLIVKDIAIGTPDTVIIQDTRPPAVAAGTVIGSPADKATPLSSVVSAHIDTKGLAGRASVAADTGASVNKQSPADTMMQQATVKKRK